MNMVSRGALMVELARKKNDIDDGEDRGNEGCSSWVTNTTEMESSRAEVETLDSGNDFDSDCSVRDKNYIPHHESESSDEEDLNENGKRTRWRKSNPKKWKRNQVKEIKKKNKAPNTVDCSKCRFKCCEKILPDSRSILCKNFWSCDFSRRKDYILQNVECRAPIRKKSSPKRKARSDCKFYFLESNGIKHRVCQKFFTSTLAISKAVIVHAFEHAGEGKIFMSEDQRGRKEPHNKTKSESVERVKQHIESFPVTESHYTRKSTIRKYLDPKLSISKMHALFVEECKKEGSTPISAITYRRIFCNNYNYAFYKPKKDQCQICMQYVVATTDQKAELEPVYSAHIARKEDCVLAKTRDKERADKEKNFLCCSFDLECVLQIPSSDVSPMYYSRKICVYNLTIYEMALPNNAFCFAWTEINGKRGSLEIGTCLYKYITQLSDSIDHIVLYSDTCSGQNRNKNITVMLLYLVQLLPHLKCIEQKFLESGHSYMEVDSMHSAIEKAQKYVPVYTIHDWLAIFRRARTSRSGKAPYKVMELKYSDFLNLELLTSQLMKNRIKSTEGEKVNWLKVKCFRYSKEKRWILEYRYDHQSDYKEINIRGLGRPIATQDIKIEKAYKKPLPISIMKKQDLLKLCKNNVIPSEFHGYYKTLPTTKQATDTITEASESEGSNED